MSAWEIGTWLAALVLGPGALVIFALFLRDARRILRELEKEKTGTGEPPGLQ